MTGRSSLRVQKKLSGRARGLLRWKKNGAKRIVARSPAGEFCITREGASFSLSLETPDGRWEDLASSAKVEPLKVIAKERSKR
jgi:hypothetical protein